MKLFDPIDSPTSFNPCFNGFMDKDTEPGA